MKESEHFLISVSFLTSLPSITCSFSCTNLWQQQQLLRPSLLRPEVDTILLFLIHRDCSQSAVNSPLYAAAAAAAALPLLSSSEECWVISLSAFLKCRSSPWSQESTQAKTTTHRTTIIMTKGEHAAYWLSPLSLVVLWSTTLISIGSFKV